MVGEEHSGSGPGREEVLGHILRSEWRLVCGEQGEDKSNRRRGQEKIARSRITWGLEDHGTP